MTSDSAPPLPPPLPEDAFPRKTSGKEGARWGLGTTFVLIWLPVVTIFLLVFAAFSFFIRPTPTDSEPSAPASPELPILLPGSGVPGVVAPEKIVTPEAVVTSEKVVAPESIDLPDAPAAVPEPAVALEPAATAPEPAVVPEELPIVTAKDSPVLPEPLLDGERFWISVEADDYARSEATRLELEPTKFKSRLPNGFGALEISDAQRKEIYRLQAEYHQIMTPLYQRADRLRAERDERIRAVLTEEQRAAFAERKTSKKK